MEYFGEYLTENDLMVKILENSINWKQISKYAIWDKSDIEKYYNNIVWEEESESLGWIVLDIYNDKKENRQYTVKNINSIEIGQEKIGLFKNVQNIETITITIP